MTSFFNVQNVGSLNAHVLAVRPVRDVGQVGGLHGMWSLFNFLKRSHFRYLEKKVVADCFIIE